MHHGAQQRLVTLGMDLGLALEKLDSEPAEAKALLTDAHTGVKEALAELRNLARGIHPAILTDRGLDAALSALAARAPIPVDVDVELPERPPASVEAAAYFVVAEGLTNIAKHAQAQRAAVGMTKTVVNALVSSSITVIDLMCDSRSYVASNYSSDGLHPNDAGYAFISAEVVKAITQSS